MSKNKEINPRLGCVGGQAVMEGVMMKSKQGIAIAVRQENGSIVARTSDFKSLRSKCKLFNVPIIRGVVNFIDMMKLSLSTMTESTEMLGIEEEEPTKFEKWLEKHFGASIIGFVSAIGVILGFALALGLFVFLPTFITGLFDMPRWAVSLTEGGLKIGLFIGYLLLVSLIPDIKRTFMYHGAEHKSIFCYESGEELTVENVRKQKRFHPRCGTSFIFVILIISILLGFLLPTEPTWLRFLLKLALIFVTVGIGFEFIMYAGKHDNIVVRVLSAPGLWMQRITTKEPDDSMIEVAIVSIKSSLRTEFPDFEIPYEKKKEEPASTADETADADNR